MILVNNDNNKRIITHFVFLLLAAAIFSGCGTGPNCPADEYYAHGAAKKPRMRLGCYPSFMITTNFLGEDFGNHGYFYRLDEKNGLAYTCRGGHIDTAHVRIGADWTAYLIAKTYYTLMKSEESFSYKLSADRSISNVKFSYPQGWNDLSKDQKKQTAKEIAYKLGGYLTHNINTWHEILTWFGFKCLGFYTEFPSAFSWEDTFCNNLGVILAYRALQDSENPWNEAFTKAFADEMEYLGIQPVTVAIKASKIVRPEWFTGAAPYSVNLKRRNFNIGLEDGTITPTLVPGLEECRGAEPVSYPVPARPDLSEYGFSFELLITPREWESAEILKIAGDDEIIEKINPLIHYPPIMEYIREQARTEYGFVDETVPANEPCRLQANPLSDEDETPEL
jgi:hypothetical protein